MKKITLIICFLFTTSLFAQSVGGGGGPKAIRLSADEVDALITKCGEYARLVDLREGFVKFEGADVTYEFVTLDPKRSRSEIKSIILRNGHETSVSSVIGGDMGGGGK
jgi:hypothetical protein